MTCVHARVTTLAFNIAFSVLSITAASADGEYRRGLKDYRPALFSWTGFYVGANVGGHWALDRTTAAMDPLLASFPNGAGFIASVDSSTPGSVTPQGIMGGLTAGYNSQSGNFLWGLEGDVNWLGGSASRSVTGFPPPVNPLDVFTTKTEASFLATLRPRAGLVFGQTLFYATGGLAVETIKTRDSFGCAGNTDIKATSDTTTRAGWTVGGGLEHAFGNQWSAKIEYLYADFGTFTTTTPSQSFQPDDIKVSHRYSDNIVRAGLNYRFSYGY